MEFLARLEDKIEIVLERHQEQVTEFVDPYLRKCAFHYLNKVTDINFSCFGGVNDAERQRIVICPYYLEPQSEMANLSIIEFKGNLEHITYSHRDFLGALLGQGIKREKIGDIYLIDQGFVVIVSQELTDFLIYHSLKIKGIPLKAQKYEPGQWQPSKPPGKLINTTVSSLRLDTIVASGFGQSRTKVTGYIKGGKVKVNWQVIEDLDYQCQENDVISFRGKGRIVISKVTGETRKGRLKVTITRYG